MLPTRQAFLDAYKKALIEAYDWAATPARLAEHMNMVTRRLDETVSKTNGRWNYSGQCVLKAWRALGRSTKERPSLTTLRLLARAEDAPCPMEV